MKRRVIAGALLAFFAGQLPALAADQAGQPPCASTITSGSEGVMVEGKEAARAGDTTGCGSTVVEGSPDVLINGKPAAVDRKSVV